MSTPALRSHLLVILAVVAGIVGTGIVFDGALAGNLHQVSVGLPPLMIGLWWAGHELGRSTAANRRRPVERREKRSD